MAATQSQQLPRFRNSSYDAISPISNPSLRSSLKGKRIIITGAGSGIGAATAVAFAHVQPAALVLCGRRLDALEATKAAITQVNPNLLVVALSVDVSREEQVESVFRQAREVVGSLDVCASFAGFFNNSGEGIVNGGDLKELWNAFEINVFGGMLVARHFFRNASVDPATEQGKEGKGFLPVLISISSALAHLPPSILQDMATPSYSASKMALAKAMEWVGKEMAGRGRVYNVHPGVVKSDMSEKWIQTSAAPDKMYARMEFDDIELPAHFCVWLASDESLCVPSGKYLYVNWDVEAIKQQSQAIYQNPFTHTMGLVGAEIFGAG